MLLFIVFEIACEEHDPEATIAPQEVTKLPGSRIRLVKYLEAREPQVNIDNSRQLLIADDFSSFVHFKVYVHAIPQVSRVSGFSNKYTCTVTHSQPRANMLPFSKAVLNSTIDIPASSAASLASLSEKSLENRLS